MNPVLLKRYCCSLVTNIKRLKHSGKGSETNMTLFLQRRSPSGANTEWVVEDEQYDFHQEIARSAFADMLHDHERNIKYYKALELAIREMHRQDKKANVLDIGTGTGLLSMMAAKCGADTITACEAFKPMADCCLKILAQNGFADKIKVIPKRSTEMTVGEGGDMPQKANILVTEVFDTELIGEGALPTFTHAHKYLLEEDCIVIPQSATIYTQVVESPLMQKFNKINDISVLDMNLTLNSPEKMKNCAGSASVHDIQLSQLSRTSFTELSECLPVLHYDWSGKTPLLKNQLEKQKFTVKRDGTAQMVFMWWDLVMWPGDKKPDTPPIVLSCGPWWHHPDADPTSPEPARSIPWRDHWMQAVYYLPHETPVRKDDQVTLVSCQDEYSLWFYLQEDKIELQNYPRPICECGVHMVWSRTHISCLNDDKRTNKFAKQMKKDINKDSTVLDLNGSSYLGLLAAKMAKKVYIFEESRFNINILQDFVIANDVKNVIIVSELNEDIVREVTNVICDPSYSSAILPWDNLIRMVSILYRYKDSLKARVIPEASEVWAVPVRFHDLHLIRQPLDICEGFDMSIFDDLVEKSRTISDDELEAQPLWEYPSVLSSTPQKIIRIDLNDLKSKYQVTDTYGFTQDHQGDADSSVEVNGFSVWCEWDVGREGGRHSAGLRTEDKDQGTRPAFDMHSRQAVHLLKRQAQPSTKHGLWSSRVVYVPETGDCRVSVCLTE